MPVLPAFCDTCGTAFNSGFFAENARGVTFAGNRSGPCPRCGGMGHVPDGVFNFVDNTIEILSAPERSISELMTLAKILKEARATGRSKEEVSQVVEKELPALSSLMKLLPENKNELYGFLGVVLAAVALYTQSGEKPPSQTVVNITQIVQVVTSEASASSALSVPVVRKQGRNEPCSCGSGKKYKVCCGALK